MIIIIKNIIIYLYYYFLENSNLFFIKGAGMLMQPSLTPGCSPLCQQFLVYCFIMILQLQKFTSPIFKSTS